METSELLTEMTADMLAMKRHSGCIARLLSAEQGSWHRLDEVVAGDEIMSRTLQEIDVADVHVSWLPYPISVYGADYCTVIFFSESLGWHNVLVFNLSAHARSVGGC